MPFERSYFAKKNAASHVGLPMEGIQHSGIPPYSVGVCGCSSHKYNVPLCELQMAVLCNVFSFYLLLCFPYLSWGEAELTEHRLIFMPVLRSFYLS